MPQRRSAAATASDPAVAATDPVAATNPHRGAYELSFEVAGDPPALKRPRHYRRRVYNPSQAEQEAFRAAALPHLPSQPLGGPLLARLEFRVLRPQGHYRSGRYSDQLKTAAPTFPARRDLDNMVKFVLDALNGVAYGDDSQIVRLEALKIYDAAHAPGATLVHIQTLPDQGSLAGSRVGATPNC